MLSPAPSETPSRLRRAWRHAPSGSPRRGSPRCRRGSTGRRSRRSAAVLAGVLAEDADRLVAGGTAKGAPVWGIAETTGGDRAVPISAIVLVPAGVIADHEVVARIHQADWEAELEVFTTVDRLIGLRSAFRAWVVETTTTASPFRFGQFTVEADNKGINLTRWEAGEVTRDDLLLPDARVGDGRPARPRLARDERDAGGGRAGVVRGRAVRRPARHGQEPARADRGRRGARPGDRADGDLVGGAAVPDAAVPAGRAARAVRRRHRRPRPGGRVARRGGRAAARVPRLDGRGDGVPRGRRGAGVDQRAGLDRPRPRSGRRGSTP